MQLGQDEQWGAEWSEISWASGQDQLLQRLVLVLKNRRRVHANEEESCLFHQAPPS